MDCKPVVFLACLLSSGLAGLPQSGGAEPASAAASRSSGASPADLVSGHVKPLLAKYCFDCHNGSKAKAGLDLTKVADDLSIIKDRKLWGRLAEYVEAGDMPPEGRPQPSEAEVEQLTRAIEEVLANVDCGRETDPGRVTMRRLNRAEYNNTIRDLVGIDFHPADDFPSDDVGYGFDNIGDVLTLPPLLFEKYLAAAEAIAEKAIVVTPAGADPQTLPESHRRIIFCTPTPETKSDLRAGDPRTIRQPGLSPPRVRGRGRPSDPVRRPGRGERRELRARHPARRGGGARLAPVPVPGRARSPVAEPGEKLRADRISISEFELASRLSYFLWCSMPDDELYAAGRRGEAADRRHPGDTGQADARRPQGRGGSSRTSPTSGCSFDLLGTINPDTGRFPRFDDDLRRRCSRRPSCSSRSVVRDDRSVLDFLDATTPSSTSGWRGTTASPGVKGDAVPPRHAAGRSAGRAAGPGEHPDRHLEPDPDLAREAGQVDPRADPRHAAAASAAERPRAEGGQGGRLTGTLRQRMEQHRANPDCATCHGRMDPLGFGLENFDAIGAWRDKDGELRRSTPRARFPAARSFAGPKELKAILKEREADFTRCLTEKLLTYALGRGLEYYDRCAVDKIVAALAQNDYRFSTLVLEIVQSDPFQKRRQREGRLRSRPERTPWPGERIHAMTRTWESRGGRSCGVSAPPWRSLAGGDGAPAASRRRRPPAAAGSAADGLLLRPQRRPHADWTPEGRGRASSSPPPSSRWRRSRTTCSS